MMDMASEAPPAASPLSPDLFDFDVPEDRIALRPARPRSSARLLVAPSEGAFQDRRVKDLPALLPPGIAVLNDTRVIAARLRGKKSTGGAVEALLLKRLGPDFWRVMLRPQRRIKRGDRILFADGLEAILSEDASAAGAALRFSLKGAALHRWIARHGETPLPPYIQKRRPADKRDKEDYQTLHAKTEGAVAAPTAGLHITPQLLSALKKKGVETAFLTLHTGAASFAPVREKNVRAHKMGAEEGVLSAQTARRVNAARARGGIVLAVGTTALRLLESAADDQGALRPFQGETALFILPGYRFKIVDALLTNFHQPRSTLFMLVAAFGGLRRMGEAYAHALKNSYRFHSYGDACLILRDGGV